MSRWVRFIIAIAVGIGLGLLYGWVVNPIEYVDTAPDTLRIDYKGDYVLMVAESYHSDGDLDQAVRRLALLGDTPAVDLVFEAMVFAERAGYTDVDMELMQSLLTALHAYPPIQETRKP